MIYEFECSKGHVTEASVPMGTQTWPCEACIAQERITWRLSTMDLCAYDLVAKRILSPTRTTFVFADTHRR